MAKDFKRASSESPRRSVTLTLTPEQREQILSTLGLRWDQVTLDADLVERMTPEVLSVDVNLVYATGQAQQGQDDGAE